MKFTAAQLTAMNWYVLEHNYRPELSVPPTQMRFTNKVNGEKVTVELEDIMNHYRNWSKQDKKNKPKKESPK